jgi:two-component system response regulator PilR (NtrC family)
MAAVLYVEDEPTIRRAVQLWLSRYGIAVHTAAGVQDAKRAVAEHALTGVFIDVWLEDGSGLDLYEWLRQEYPSLAGRVAFVTGDTAAGERLRERIADTGCELLTKPFDLEAVKAVAVRWLDAVNANWRTVRPDERRA